MIRNAFLAEEAASILCDEDIVLDTYTTEVLICLKHVKVEELSAVLLGFPVIDKSRDEVDTRFVSDYEAFL